MPFDWNSLGPAPGPTDLELIFIGPGFGECILVHVGYGRWVVVDSCIDATDSEDKRPVAERCLRAMGIDLANQVDLIVATHWHADHIKGIGRLAEQCTSAKFSCAQSMVRPEFLVFVEEMSTAAIATEGAKLSDFREAIRHIRNRGTVIRWATGGKMLASWEQPGQPGKSHCSVTALSPSDREFELFLVEIAAAQPRHAVTKRAAASRTPNLASVVLHVRFGDCSVLLGADMETHHDPLRGWTAAIAEGVQHSLVPAGLLKVPHHGSETGHHEELFSRLLERNPIGVVTPFNRLPDARKLPTASDVARLNSLTSQLYATAALHRTPSVAREAAVERSLRESNIQIREAAVPLGVVRCVRVGSEWQSRVFAPAAALHD